VAREAGNVLRVTSYESTGFKFRVNFRKAKEYYSLIRNSQPVPLFFVNLLKIYTVKATEFNWTTKDALNISAKDWQPEGEVKAVIALVHGFGEHSGRYEHVAEFFGKDGYAMVAYDRRGHGKSEGKRGHTKSYEAYLEEIDQLLAYTRERYAGKPVLLYGHSQGGNLVLSYMLRRRPDVKGIIVTAPWIRLAFEPPSALIAIGKFTRRLMPSFSQNNQLKEGHLSRDASVGTRYVADPLVHTKITSETGIGMLESCDWLLENAGEVHRPLLVMHGTGDEIISIEGTRDFLKKSSGNITFKEWEGAYHEIHNETNKEEVLQYALDWMNRV